MGRTVVFGVFNHHSIIKMTQMCLYVVLLIETDLLVPNSSL